MPGIKDAAFNGADDLLAPFKPTWQKRFREFESISAVGYERRFGPRHRYDRSTPESRPSSGNVRISTRSFRFTSKCRRYISRCL